MFPTYLSENVVRTRNRRHPSLIAKCVTFKARIQTAFEANRTQPHKAIPYPCSHCPEPTNCLELFHCTQR